MKRTALATLEVADMARESQELVDQWQLGCASGTHSIPVFADESAIFGFDTQFKRYNGDRNGAFTAEQRIKTHINPTILDGATIPTLSIHPTLINYQSPR
ncbi:unnamed protein product [Bursaphelenchus xylophilus]|uniref:(pine wood nematode) hypothetical protein n=1 Tax=Bursaphelenchus xylophilus TaxID=6326 RepID=A0A1I7SEB6_BURXY|nr:unnamed protein product [Bursaphelenchus xylophilus]CAG9087434.1 unnamed protein product [Bursaphelenchus xylophilus]